MTARFRYRAASAAGRVVEGVLQAPSRQTAIAELERQQLYPVAIDEVLVKGSSMAPRRLGRRAAVTLWCRSAATLLGAGLPLDRVLGFTAAHVGHADLSEALKQIRRSVQGGSSLADALVEHTRFFDPLFVATVSAGESSGALETVFERLAEHLEESAELRSQVRSALLYPGLMAIVGSLGVVILLGFVIPRFAAILSDVGGGLPFSTRLLMSASAVVTRGWWVWLLLGTAAAYGIPTALARPEVRRRWHSARLGLPWVGDLERKYVTARFARTLGLVLRSGIPVLPALKIARTSAGNMVIREELERAAAAVSEGSALAPALASTLPPLAVQMIAVGEESGHLEDLCLRVADSYDSEIRRSLRTTVALIEPAMILLFGSLVGFVALAMLQAIYGINLNAF
jgi:type II secretory pathway component PulF